MYAIVGAASFVDASTNYAHPWWQWLVGPPAGGYCDTLVQQSRALMDEATRLDGEAAALRTSQEPGRQSRARQQAALLQQIDRHELSETKRHEQELRVAHSARELAGDGLDTVVGERRLMDAAVARATERLMAELEDQSRLVR